MPELPEVEITRRHLERSMRGRSMEEVEVSHLRTARYNSGPREVADRTRGRRIESVDRIGKFLLMPLDDAQTVVGHLGMSGRFHVAAPEEQRVAHTHFSALLDSGEEVRFIDPRTFGFIAVYDTDDLAASALPRLGRDAWSSPPSAADLSNRLDSRIAPIKALLLDQSILAGLGNIYADEALFGAGIDPRRPGGSLTVTEIERLLGSVRVVLERAIDNGGTSLDDLAYLLPDGRAGENMRRLQVYGRDGQPCVSCGTPISRIVLRQRSTHFCEFCQG